jgi:hypothetical protein|tara:strand:- start:81 stop:395 length:315 start_codon:yes stop_codon:yes gene_type:complete
VEVTVVDVQLVEQVVQGVEIIHQELQLQEYVDKEIQEDYILLQYRLMLVVVAVERMVWVELQLPQETGEDMVEQVYQFQQLIQVHPYQELVAVVAVVLVDLLIP